MDETTGQLRRELNIALDGVTQLADRMTSTVQRINTLFDNDRALIFQIETARGETMILLRVIAGILARECIQHPNPSARLEVLLKEYFMAADVFTSEPTDTAFDDELRKLGIAVSEPTAEELKDQERDAATSESYRGIATALLEEASKIILAVQKR